MSSIIRNWSNQFIQWLLADTIPYRIQAGCLIFCALSCFWPYCIGLRITILETTPLRVSLTSFDALTSFTMAITVAIPLILDLLFDIATDFYAWKDKKKKKTEDDSHFTIFERVLMFTGFLLYPCSCYLDRDDLALFGVCTNRFQFVAVYGSISLSFIRFSSRTFPPKICGFLLLCFTAGFNLTTYETIYGNLTDSIHFYLGGFLKICILGLLVMLLVWVMKILWKHRLYLLTIMKLTNIPVEGSNHTIGVGNVTNLFFQKQNSSSTNALETTLDMYNLAFVTTILACALLHLGIAGNTVSTTLTSFTPAQVAIQQLGFSILELALLMLIMRKIKFDAGYRLSALIEQKISYLRYIAHELRTPLNSAFLGQKLLVMELQQGIQGLDIDENTPEAWAETANDVLKALNVAVELLTDMMSVSQLENDLLRLHKHNIPVLSMIKESVVTFCAEARAKSIVLIIEPLHSTHLISPDILEDMNNGGTDNAVIGGGSVGGIGIGNGNIIVSPLLMHDTIAIDKSKIIQALRNIVANAIKYSTPGSIVTIRAGFVSSQQRHQTATSLARRMSITSHGKNDKGSFRSHGKRGHKQDSLKSMGSSIGMSLVQLNISGRSTNEEDVLIPRSPRSTQLDHGLSPIQTHLPSDNPLLNDHSSPDTTLGTNSIRSFHQRLNHSRHHIKSQHHLAHKNTTKKKSGSLVPSSSGYLATSRNKKKIVVGSVNESAASEVELDRKTANGHEEVQWDDGELMITVTDHGVGMIEDDLRLLFRSGVHFNPDQLQASGGSGLGLYIAQGMVELHGGVMEATSPGLGEGCTFTMILPMKKALGLTTEKKKQAPRLGSAFGQGLGPGQEGGLGSSRKSSPHDDDHDDNDYDDDDPDVKAMMMGTWSSEKQLLLLDDTIVTNSSRLLATSAKRSAKDDVHLDLDNLLPATTGIFSSRGGNAWNNAKPQKSMGPNTARSDQTPDVGGGGSGVATYRETSCTTINAIPTARSPSPWNTNSNTVGGGGGGGNTARSSQLNSGQMSVERLSLDSTSLQWSSRAPGPFTERAPYGESYYGGLGGLGTNHHTGNLTDRGGVGMGSGGGRGGGEKMYDTPRSGRIGGGGGHIEDASYDTPRRSFHPKSSTVPYAGPYYHILVVDDSALTRKMLVKTLKAIGHTCEEAEDGQIAVDKVKEKGDLTAYDAILMDFVMPVMDGPRATKEIRALGVTVPIIGCTGNTLEKDVDVFRQSGCDRVLGKPFDMDLFHHCMTELYGTNTTNNKIEKSFTVPSSQHQPPPQSILGSIREKDKEKNSSEDSQHQSLDGSIRDMPWTIGEIGDEYHDNHDKG